MHNKVWPRQDSLKISQTHLIENITQGFNNSVKEFMNLNKLYTSHKWIWCKQVHIFQKTHRINTKVV